MDNTTKPNTIKYRFIVDPNQPPTPTKVMATSNQQQDSIQTLVKELQAQLDELRKENKTLKEQIELLQPKKQYIPTDSDSEEEIVARETAWLLPKNKKRKATSSPEKDENVNSNKPKESTKPKTQKPPPVIVSNIKDYKQLNDTLKVTNIQFATTLMNNEQIKINVNTESEYRELTKHMNESKQEWHSYENKQTRPIRVMVKNLHRTCDPADIKAELEAKNFKIVDVINKYKKNITNGKVTIIPLPMFMLTFENTENVKRIFEIQYLQNTRVKVEAIKTNQLIPQCKKCQRYGHTQKYCQHSPICVKCAGKHLTAVCTKPASVAPKCINCGEAHPASYRGCVVAKELQKRRDVQRKPKTTARSMTQVPNNVNIGTTRTGVSYAQATQANINQTEPEQEASVMSMMQNMMTMLNNITQRLDTLEAKQTGTIHKNK